MSKKLEQKQRRREAEERKKAEARKESLRRNALTIIVALVVAAVVVVAIVLQRSQGGGAVPDVVGVSESEANCSEIESPEDMGRDHIAEGEAHAPYSSSPPTSGPHYEVPSGTEFFTEQLPPETLVHNLEHGQIVIWYSPDADAETLDQIEALQRQETTATVAAPYGDIQTPYQFALSAWGKLQMCEKVSQDVVDDFRRRFQGKSPEPLTEPFEG